MSLSEENFEALKGLIDDQAKIIDKIRTAVAHGNLPLAVREGEQIADMNYTLRNLVGLPPYMHKLDVT
jgi:hypothetical protein